MSKSTISTFELFKMLPVADTITPQYREGEVNVRATATATIAATIANGHYTYVEVVNWEAARVGSCS